MTELQTDIDAQGLEQALKAFPERLQRDIVNSVAARGAQVVKKHAKRNIKSNGSIDSGTLYNSLRTAKVKGRHGVYRVFTDASAPHSHIVEYGTGPRKLDQPREVKIGNTWVTIEHTGSMPAKPFFRPALDESEIEVLQEMKKRAAKRMAKVSEQMSQKYSRLSKTLKRKMAK